MLITYDGLEISPLAEGSNSSGLHLQVPPPESGDWFDSPHLKALVSAIALDISVELLVNPYARPPEADPLPDWLTPRLVELHLGYVDNRSQYLQQLSGPIQMGDRAGHWVAPRLRKLKVARPDNRERDQLQHLVSARRLAAEQMVAEGLAHPGGCPVPLVVEQYSNGDLGSESLGQYLGVES
jgi:hypothetical protein